MHKIQYLTVVAIKEGNVATTDKSATIAPRRIQSSGSNSSLKLARNFADLKIGRTLRALTKST